MGIYLNTQYQIIPLIFNHCGHPNAKDFATWIDEFSTKIDSIKLGSLVKRKSASCFQNHGLDIHEF